MHPVTKQLTEIELRHNDFKAYARDLIEVLRAREVTIHELQEQRHLQRAAKQARRRGVDHTVFNVGDWVMVRSAFRTKLAPKWIGPAKVIATSSDGHTIEVDFLDPAPTTRHKRKTSFHVTQVQFFNYNEVALSQNATAFAEYLARKEHVIAELRKVRFEEDGQFWQVLVEWQTGDVTWEPLQTIDSSSPELVDALLQSLQRNGEDISKVQRARAKYKRGAPVKRTVGKTRDSSADASSGASSARNPKQHRSD